MRARAHGRILFWEGASLWIFAAPPHQRYPRTDRHAHHVVQVTLALTGRVDFEGTSERASGAAVAIAPDAPHTFEANGLTAHLFVASEGQEGRAIVRGLFSKRSLAPVHPARLGDFPARLKACFENPGHSDEELRALGRGLVTRLAGEGSEAAATDARIEKVLAWLTPRLDQPVSLSEVASIAGLSAGRTRHLFVQQTGLPLRTYLLWLRLVRAVELFAEGARLTDAAHGAGFADSAHLSRTFRRMFGISAATLSVTASGSSKDSLASFRGAVAGALPNERAEGEVGAPVVAGCAGRYACAGEVGPK